MNIEVKKLTGVELLRKANSFTTGHESKMSLATAYKLSHSPIRTQLFWIECRYIPLFVVSQFVRSHVGVQFFQRSHRHDRNKDAKDEGRMTLTDLAFIINAEAIINMSRKRLCAKASKETREVWQKVCELIEECDPDLYPHLVPPCVATGVCRESKSCDYINTEKGIEARKNYKELFR